MIDLRDRLMEAIEEMLKPLLALGKQNHATTGSFRT